MKRQEVKAMCQNLEGNVNENEARMLHLSPVDARILSWLGEEDRNRPPRCTLSSRDDVLEMMNKVAKENERVSGTSLTKDRRRFVLLLTTKKTLIFQ